MRDLVHNLGLQQLIAPAVQSATITSAGVDLLNFNSAMVVFNTGAIAGSGDFTAKLQESDDNAAFNDLDPADQIGALPASLAQNAAVKVGYIGNKRYLRAVATKNSGTSIALGATLVQGGARSKPVA